MALPFCSLKVAQLKAFSDVHMLRKHESLIKDTSLRNMTEFSTILFFSPLFFLSLSVHLKCVPAALFPRVCCSSFCVRTAYMKRAFLFSQLDRSHSAAVSNDVIQLTDSEML